MNILKKDSGETIVEVLLAITVAAFALGASYAIANKSLQKSLSARERNESSSIAQSQIASLKLREQQMDPVTFSSLEASGTLPANFLHFCLDEATTSASQTNGNWGPISNNGQVTGATALTTSGNPSYAAATVTSPGCTRTIDNVTYYIDIVAMETPASLNSKPPTVYQVNVRWPQIATAETNQLTIYYRF